MTQRSANKIIEFLANPTMNSWAVILPLNGTYVTYWLRLIAKYDEFLCSDTRRHGGVHGQISTVLNGLDSEYN